MAKLDFVCCRPSFPINWMYMSADIAMRRYQCSVEQIEWLNNAKPGEFMRFKDDLIFCTVPVDKEV